MKYLVMECHESYCVLLDEHGRFHCAANLHYKVGQQVMEPVLMIGNLEKTEKIRLPLRQFLSFGLAMCLLLACISVYSFYQLPYMSFLLTINPSVRIEMSRSGKVLNVEGINPDGIVLVEGYSAQGKDRWAVTDELIERSIELGFLSAGGHVTIEIEGSEETAIVKTTEELHQHFDEWSKNHQNIVIEICDDDDDDDFDDNEDDFDDDDMEDDEDDNDDDNEIEDDE